ncbi:MAG: hypothetical protein K2X81_19215, partial [Candidatus Obscuribacterales bacterium]|nr:hypothetical protein [Candidatus Obscuribacterales bacterium]
FNVSVKTKVSLWVEPATVAYNAQYKQSFNTTWDAAIFNGQWDTMAAFDANDIAAGYLQFVWVTKRIIRSKSQLPKMVRVFQYRGLRLRNIN